MNSVTTTTPLTRMGSYPNYKNNDLKKFQILTEGSLDHHLPWENKKESSISLSKINGAYRFLLQTNNCKTYYKKEEFRPLFKVCGQENGYFLTEKRGWIDLQFFIYYTSLLALKKVCCDKELIEKINKNQNKLKQIMTKKINTTKLYLLEHIATHLISKMKFDTETRKLPADISRENRRILSLLEKETNRLKKEKNQKFCLELLESAYIKDHDKNHVLEAVNKIESLKKELEKNLNYFTSVHFKETQQSQSCSWLKNID